MNIIWRNSPKYPNVLQLIIQLLVFVIGILSETIYKWEVEGNNGWFKRLLIIKNLKDVDCTLIVLSNVFLTPQCKICNNHLLTFTTL